MRCSGEEKMSNCHPPELIFTLVHGFEVELMLDGSDRGLDCYFAADGGFLYEHGAFCFSPVENSQIGCK